MSPQRAKDLPLRWVRCPRLGLPTPPPPGRTAPGPEPARPALSTSLSLRLPPLPPSSWLPGTCWSSVPPRPLEPTGLSPAPHLPVLGLAGSPHFPCCRPAPASLPAQASLHTRVGGMPLSISNADFAHVCPAPTLCWAVQVWRGLTVGPTVPGGPRSPLVPLAPAMPG